MDLPTPVLCYFGERWESGIFDSVICKQISPPTDQPCFQCKESIGEADRGLMRAVLRCGGDQFVNSMEPIHAECDLRMVAGSLAHIKKRCSCFGGTNTHNRVGTLREEARAVLTWINKQRQTQGLGPMW